MYRLHNGPHVLSLDTIRIANFVNYLKNVTVHLFTLTLIFSLQVILAKKFVCKLDPVIFCNLTWLRITMRHTHNMATSTQLYYSNALWVLTHVL